MVVMKSCEGVKPVLWPCTITSAWRDSHHMLCTRHMHGDSVHAYGQCQITCETRQIDRVSTYHAQLAPMHFQSSQPVSALFLEHKGCCHICQPFCFRGDDKSTTLLHYMCVGASCAWNSHWGVDRMLFLKRLTNDLLRAIPHAIKGCCTASDIVDVVLEGVHTPGLGCLTVLSPQVHNVLLQAKNALLSPVHLASQ